MEFTLADADKYDENPDDGGDDNPGGNDEPTGTPVSEQMPSSIRRVRLPALS